TLSIITNEEKDPTTVALLQVIEPSERTVSVNDSGPYHNCPPKPGIINPAGSYPIATLARRMLAGQNSGAIKQLPLAGLITLATAQYGPAPPRLNIPGAIPLPPIREERLLPQQPPQVIRVRRPGAVRIAAPNAIHHQLPSATPKFHDLSTIEHKPVTEEPEDDFRPAFIPQLQPH
uniref:Uncharacterized protein n=1 Tax=Anopheles maculatus TaxID=74869 RepID=A0A182T1Q0_9DIPT